MRQLLKAGAKVKLVSGCRALELYQGYLNSEDTYTVSRSSGFVVKIIEDPWPTLFRHELELCED